MIEMSVVDPAFKRVEDALGELTAADGGAGAAVSLVVDGKRVVDTASGVKENGRPWTQDTLVCVFSTTKGAASFCLQLLVDRGLLDVDAPVTRYWPEFGANGKDSITVRHVLQHTCGIPMPAEIDNLLATSPDTLVDQDAMARLAAEAAPQFPIGGPFIYHHVMFGYLAAELCRRASGRGLREFFRSEIADPLDLDFHVGVPRSEQGRICPALPPEMPAGDDVHPIVAGTVAWLTHFTNLTNGQAWRDGEIWASNGHATARGIADMYAPLALGGEYQGVWLTTPESIARFSNEEVTAMHPVTGTRLRRGLGYMLFDDDMLARGVGAHAFGHDGAGGSIGFADPEARLALGLVRSQMVIDPESTRRVIEAAYSCL